MMVSERYILSREEETICQAIVHASITVHKELGPGLLEKIYELCLAEELKMWDSMLNDRLPILCIIKTKLLKRDFA